jgi:hypothetical protein
VSHLIVAKQCSTAAPSQGIGGSNGAGTSTSLARADHDHTIRETGGPTNLTVGVVADGQFLKRSGSTIIGVTSSGGGGLLTKAGSVLAASFSGNPKIATVTFTTPFADTNYAPVVTSITSGNSGFGAVVNNKTTNGFQINMMVNNIANLISVEWVATKYGESM